MWDIHTLVFTFFHFSSDFHFLSQFFFFSSVLSNLQRRGKTIILKKFEFFFKKCPIFRKSNFLSHKKPGFLEVNGRLKQRMAFSVYILSPKNRTGAFSFSRKDKKCNLFFLNEKEWNCQRNTNNRQYYQR